MLDLVRMSRRRLFPPGGVELYRQIALLTDLGPGQEVLDAACGPGVCLEYFVTEYDAQGSGVDYDPAMVEVAEALARKAGLSDRMHLQQATLDALPYRDEIFDVVVGELGLTVRSDPEAAVKELVRVAKPGGRVALVQLVWKAPVEEMRRKVLAEHLGTRPLMLVEWKRMLREAGVTGLHTEDWSDEETAFRPQVKKPFPDFSELFTLPEKIGILRRAWGRWGFSGVRAAISREIEVHRVLTKERILGLDLLIGTKAPAPAEPSVAEDHPREGDGGRVSVGGAEAGPPQADVGKGPVGATESAGPEPLAPEAPASQDLSAPETLAPAETSEARVEDQDAAAAGAPPRQAQEMPGERQAGAGKQDTGAEAADVEGLPLFTRDEG
jgi:SAM-dependent methyltransferase